MSDEEQAVPEKWYDHIGYLLTGLYRTDGNIVKLAEEMKTPVSTLRGAIKRASESHGLNLVAIREMLVDKDNISLDMFFKLQGFTGEQITEMVPMRGVDPQLLNEEQAAKVHEATVRCPLCGEYRKHRQNEYDTSKRDETGKPLRIFVKNVYECGTELNPKGYVSEGNRCARKQKKNALMRGRTPHV
jgi:hypothetical protein